MNDKPIAHYSGIGGLAVMDGVMMRNKDKYAIAVRQPDGGVALKIEHYRAILEDTVWLKIPFIRGVFVFLDSMRLSFKTMSEAAEAPEHEGDVRAGKSSGFIERIMMGITFVFSLVLAFLLFVMAPYFIASFLTDFILSDSLLSLIEGIIRIFIFIAYVLLISRLKDIRCMFGYHGAEHKCINCLESGMELNVENVRAASRLHKRCGSSFMLFVMLVSIVLFFFIHVDSMVWRLVLRILLLPVVSGISYELIRLAGRNDNPFVQALSAPGFWMQRLTTREPDDGMIEVGIKSVEAVFDWRRYLSDTYGYVYD